MQETLTKYTCDVCNCKFDPFPVKTVDTDIGGRQVKISLNLNQFGIFDICSACVVKFFEKSLSELLRLFK